MDSLPCQSSQFSQSSLTLAEQYEKEYDRLSMLNDNYHSHIGPCVTPSSYFVKGAKHHDGGIFTSIYTSLLYQGRTDIKFNDIIDACDEKTLNILALNDKKARYAILMYTGNLISKIVKKLQNVDIRIIDNNTKFTYGVTEPKTRCMIIRNDTNYSAYLPGLTDQFEVAKFAAVVINHTSYLTRSTYSKTYLEDSKPLVFLNEYNFHSLDASQIREFYKLYRTQKSTLDAKHKVELEEMQAIQAYRNKKIDDQYNDHLEEIKKLMTVVITPKVLTDAEQIAKAITGNMEAIEHIIAKSIKLGATNMRKILTELLKSDMNRDKQCDLVCKISALISEI